MSTLKIPHSQPPRATRALSAQWVRDVADLMSEVKSWASHEGWQTGTGEMILTERGIGTYTVPTLTVTAPVGRLTLEPVALRTPELSGRVDVYAYPSLARMVLLRDPDASPAPWILRTSDEVDWPQPWGKETFIRIAKSLLRIP